MYNLDLYVLRYQITDANGWSWTRNGEICNEFRPTETYTQNRTMANRLQFVLIIYYRYENDIFTTCTDTAKQFF